MADGMSDISCIFAFLPPFCSMFSSQLHYKIEQKNHSPSNFAWVSKDKVGWHGVGENELNIRLNKEKKKTEMKKGFSGNIIRTAGKKRLCVGDSQHSSL